MIIKQNANKNKQSGKEINRSVETQASQSFLLGHGEIKEDKSFELPGNVYVVFYSPLNVGITASYKHLISNEIRDYGDKKFTFEGFKEFRNSLYSKLVLGGAIGYTKITPAYLSDLSDNKGINLVTLSEPGSVIPEHFLGYINGFHSDMYEGQYQGLIENFRKVGKTMCRFSASYQSYQRLSELCHNAPKNEVTVYHWLACRTINNQKKECINYPPLSVTTFLENKQDLAKYQENIKNLGAEHLKNKQSLVIEYLERQCKDVTEKLKHNQIPDQLKRKRTPDQPKVMENYTQNNSSNKMPRMR